MQVYKFFKRANLCLDEIQANFAISSCGSILVRIKSPNWNAPIGPVHMIYNTVRGKLQVRYPYINFNGLRPRLIWIAATLHAKTIEISRVDAVDSLTDISRGNLVITLLKCGK